MSELMDLNKNYQRFLRNLKKFPKADQSIIKKAYQLARKSHSGQKRDEGPPYIIHPIRMANILIEELKIKDPLIIAAALLHDVVEDTAATLKNIKETFGSRVYRLVRDVTRWRPKNETEAQKKKSKKKYFSKVMEEDEESRLVKVVDLLDNLRSWPFIPNDSPSQEKFRRWSQEARLYYLPLAKKTNNYIYQGMKKIVKSSKKYVLQPKRF